MSVDFGGSSYQFQALLPEGFYLQKLPTKEEKYYMGNRIDVYVKDRDGRPVSGTSVTIDISGIWKGGTLDQYTDGSGHASYETADNYKGNTKLMIRVRKRSFGPYNISGGSFTVTLD